MKMGGRCYRPAVTSAMLTYLPHMRYPAVGQARLQGSATSAGATVAGMGMADSYSSTSTLIYFHHYFCLLNSLALYSQVMMVCDSRKSSICLCYLERFVSVDCRTIFRTWVDVKASHEIVPDFQLHQSWKALSREGLRH